MILCYCLSRLLTLISLYYPESYFQFAAVQFSSQPRKVFDFNDYHSGKATKLLRNEGFMQSITNTYKALDYTLWVETNLFLPLHEIALFQGYSRIYINIYMKGI